MTNDFKSNIDRGEERYNRQVREVKPPVNPPLPFDELTDIGMECKSCGCKFRANKDDAADGIVQCPSCNGKDLMLQ